MGASQQGGHQQSRGNPSTSSASSSTSWASGPTTSGTSASWGGWSSWSTWTSGAQHRPRHDGGQGPVRQERKARQWADWQQWERAWHTEWSELVRRSGSTPTPGAGEEWSAMLNRHRHRPRPWHDGEEQRDPEQRDPPEPDLPDQPQGDQPDGRGQQPEQCQQAGQTEGPNNVVNANTPPDLVEEAEDIIDALLDSLEHQPTQHERQHQEDGHVASEHKDDKEDQALLQWGLAGRRPPDTGNTMNDYANDLPDDDDPPDYEHKDDDRQSKSYGDETADEGDEVAWVQRTKRKRGDGDPENHTDYTDLTENAQGSGGPPEGEEHNHGGPQIGEGEGEAAETHACDADCDLEEQQRVERELEEERALQDEWEQDRALHEEWVQKTIDEYHAEEDGRGANRPPEGTAQMQAHQQHHHVAAVTMALNRWMVGATATGGMEIEVDSVVSTAPRGRGRADVAPHRPLPDHVQMATRARLAKQGRDRNDGEDLARIPGNPAFQGGPVERGQAHRAQHGGREGPEPSRDK